MFKQQMTTLTYHEPDHPYIYNSEAIPIIKDDGNGRRRRRVFLRDSASNIKQSKFSVTLKVRT